MAAFFRRISVLLMAICGTGLLAAAPPEPFSIHAILSLTGSAAFLGKAEAESLRAVEVVINHAGGIRGRPVRFIIEDDQTNPTVAVQLANAIVAAHEPALIGPSLVATCSAVYALLKDNGPVESCLSPAVYPPPGAYEFSAGSASRDSIVASLRYFHQRNWHRAALLTSNDATGQDAEKNVRDVMNLPENRDITLAVSEHFNPADLGVAAQLARVQSAKPDAFFVLTTGTAFGQVLRDLLQSGFEIPVLTNSGNALTTELDQFAAVLPKELYFSAPVGLTPSAVGPGPIYDASMRFQAALKARGVIPDVGYVYSWDPALILAAALNRVGPDATATQVRDFIVQLHGFIGINGVYDFRDGTQRGLTVNGNILVRFDPSTKRFIAVTGPGGKKQR
jgi:branched-chain amino acid transport system substrate-binding protein